MSPRTESSLWAVILSLLPILVVRFTSALNAPSQALWLIVILFFTIFLVTLAQWLVQKKQGRSYVPDADDPVRGPTESRMLLSGMFGLATLIYTLLWPEHANVGFILEALVFLVTAALFFYGMENYGNNHPD